MESPSFRRLAGTAAFPATLIWLFFLFLGDRLRWETRDEFMRLHENPLMTVRGGITMACFVFAVLAMAGVHERIKDRSGELSLGALIFFTAGTIIDAAFRGVEWLTVHRTWARTYVATDDESVRADILLKIDLFDEAGIGLAFAFGSFFAVSGFLFAIATWSAHRPLSVAFFLSGLFVVVAYGAALFATPVSSAWWTFYELLQITLYITIGTWLLRAEE